MAQRRAAHAELGLPWPPDVLEELQKGLALLDQIAQARQQLSVTYSDQTDQLNAVQLQREWAKAEKAIWPQSMLKGKSSMLGAASGAVAGLVAITPACGTVGPMGAIFIGALSGFICIWGVNGLKHALGADDALDVFGVHGVGGIVGAILTGVFAAPGLGGTQGADFAMGHQVFVQVKSVLFTIVWSGVVAFIAYKIADLLVGLRVPEEAEREGLDITSHGETAYNR